MNAMRRRTLTQLSLAVALAACGDREQSADAELARDLQLAMQQPANPQLQDIALNDAAVPETPRAATPARTTRPSPRRSTPSPVSRTTTVASAPRPAESRRAEPTPSAQPDAPAPAAGRGIASGTGFGLATRGQVCTSNLPGDKVVATITEPVTGENGASLPAGTAVVLEVISVTPGDTPETARISLRVRSIVYGAEPVGVEASVAVLSQLERGEIAKNGGSDKKKVIGGAIAGAVIGQVMGRDTRSTVIGAAAGAAAGTAAAAATRRYHACLPAGSSLRVTTSQPIPLSD